MLDLSFNCVIDKIIKHMNEKQLKTRRWRTKKNKQKEREVEFGPMFFIFSSCFYLF